MTAAGLPRTDFASQLDDDMFTIELDDDMLLYI